MMMNAASAPQTSPHATLYMDPGGPRLEYDKPEDQDTPIGYASDNKALLEEMLRAWGLEIVEGELRSIDGVAATATNAAASQEFGDAPPLPEMSSVMADDGLLHSQIEMLSGRDDLQDVSLGWASLFVLARMSMDEMRSARQLRIALQTNKIAAKSETIDANEARIEAEKDAAFERFAWSVGAAVVSLVAPSFGKAGETGGQALGRLVNSMGEVQTKVYGSQARADKAQLLQLRWEREEEMINMHLEDAKSNYQEASRLFQKALEIIESVMRNRVQETQALTRV